MAVSALVLAVAMACGETPTAQEPADGGAGAPAPATASTVGEGDADGRSATGTGLEEVSAELDGLDREARRERLIEMAQEEGGAISFYGSTNIDDVAPVIDGSRTRPMCR